MTWYWVSTKLATGGIEIDKNGDIITTPPFWKKWRGKPFNGFISMLNNQGALKGLKRLNVKE
jgi:hypothetical protein